MVELFTRSGSSKPTTATSSRRNSNSSRRSFLSFGRKNDTAGPVPKEVERFFPVQPPVPEIDVMSHSSSSRGGIRRELQREIIASRSSRLLMRQVSALGLEDPAHGEFGRQLARNNNPHNGNGNHASGIRQHPSHIFEDMDLNDLPPDMREDESIASDPTAVVIVDRSLLMDLAHPMPDDASAKQSSTGGRPSDASTKSHSKMSTTGSTAPSTAPSRASYYQSRNSRRCMRPPTTSTCFSTTRSNAVAAALQPHRSPSSLLAEAAQAMMVSGGVSSADPLMIEAMGQSDRDLRKHHAAVGTMAASRASGLDGSVVASTSASKHNLNNHRRQSFCSYVPPQSFDRHSHRHHNETNHDDNENDDESESRAMPDMQNIFPTQQSTQPPTVNTPSPGARSVRSSLSRRSVGGNHSSFNNNSVAEGAVPDDHSAANSFANNSSAARSMSSASPWRQPAPWNDEVAPSIFFKSKGPSATLSPPGRRNSLRDENENTMSKDSKEAVSSSASSDQDDDLEPEELEQLKSELAELEAALSFR